MEEGYESPPEKKKRGPKQKRVTYNDAQDTFITETRRQIDAGKCPAFDNDWSNIQPPRVNLKNKRGRNPIQHYYLKPIAVWVPHLIIPGHVPVCPVCQSSKGVDVSRAIWIQSAKTVYGLKTHKYLDTKMYLCHTCNRRFYGNNAESMALGNSRILGNYSFANLSRAYAIDEELYQYIAASFRLPTLKIRDQLRQFVVEHYNNTLMRYLLDAKQGRVIPIAESQSETRRHDMELIRPQLEHLKKRRLELAKAEKDAADVDLKQLRAFKDDHNNKHTPFQGVGVSKLDKIIESGYLTGREFLAGAEADDEQFDTLRAKCKQGVCMKWVNIFQLEFSKRESLLANIKADVERLEDEIPDEFLEESESEDDNSVLGAMSTFQEFSKVDDPEGYAALFVHKNCINDILMEEFNRQRFTLRDRMIELGGEFLYLHVIDEHFQNIHAYSDAQKKTIRPYKGMTVVLNEKGMCIWWAVIPKSRSLDDLLGPLARLKSRLDRLNCNVKAVFADDIPNLGKLQKVFQVVAFDVFQWLDRWEQAFLDPAPVNRESFRILMCKSVLAVAPEQFRKERTRLTKELGRRPTLREILKDCLITVPTPEEQELSVMAVLYYFYRIDIQNELERVEKSLAGPVSSRKQRMFKCFSELEYVVEAQISCVRESCLSMTNQANNGITQLRDNIQRAIFAEVEHCGVRRAERSIWSVLDNLNSKIIEDGKEITPTSGGSNDNNSSDDDEEADDNDDEEANSTSADSDTASKLPEGPQHQQSTQHKFVNYLASQIGLPDPPYVPDKAARLSSVGNGEAENLGFDVGFDIAGDDATFNEDVDYSGGETELGYGEEGRTVGTWTVETFDATAAGDNEVETGAALVDHINKTVSRHERAIPEMVKEIKEETGGRSPIEVFNGLSKKESWATFVEVTPFDNDADDKASAEERKVFAEMRYTFNPLQEESMKQFQLAWNWEVGRRVKALCGDIQRGTTILKRKEIQHLQDQYKLLTKEVVSKHRVVEDYTRDQNHFKHYCYCCGFPKDEHKSGDSFGPTCHKNCCARCNGPKLLHAQLFSGMGFFCYLNEQQCKGRVGRIVEFDQMWRKNTFSNQETRKRRKSATNVADADEMEEGDPTNGTSLEKAETGEKGSAGEAASNQENIAQSNLHNNFWMHPWYHMPVPGAQAAGVQMPPMVQTGTSRKRKSQNSIEQDPRESAREAIKRQLLNSHGKSCFHSMCVKCGFRRKEHALEEKFGDKCTRDFCARCMALQKWHEEYKTIGMGAFCFLTAEQSGGNPSRIAAFDERVRGIGSELADVTNPTA